MGVRGLLSYMEQTSSCHRARIKDLLQDYRGTDNREAVVVVDGNSTMASLYGAEGRWLNGGQLVEFKARLMAWVDAWITLGVRLVFFFDGYLPPNKRTTWFMRRSGKLRDVEALLDKLDTVKEAELQHELATQKGFLIPFDGLNYTAAHIFRHCCRCEVFVTTKDCDEEIADYAIRNSCFAILGHDSDFVIYDFKGYYFASHKFNIGSMTTQAYDRLRLAKKLGISTDQLPLFAALAGNDIAPRDKMASFYMTILNIQGANRSLMALGPKIADWIRDFPKNERLCRQELQKKLVSCGLGALAQDVLTSLDGYNRVPTGDDDEESCDNNNWDSLVSRSKELHMNCELDPRVYEIVKWSFYRSTIVFEDFRQKDLPPSAALNSRLRRLIYGVLLLEKPGKDKKVEELVIDSREFSHTSFPQVEPLYPPKELHPGLLVLWDGEESPEKVDMRWALLGHIMDLTPNQLCKVKLIRPTQIVPFLSLLYILKEMKDTWKSTVQEWEVAALVALAVTLPSYTDQRLKELPASRFDSRATRFYTLFCRTCATVMLAVQICGSPFGQNTIQLYNYMDGKLYQMKYKLAKRSFEEGVENFGDVLCSEEKFSARHQQHISDFKKTFDLISSFSGRN